MGSDLHDFAHVADVGFERHGREIARLDVVGPEPPGDEDLVQLLVEDDVVEAGVEMAVVVDVAVFDDDAIGAVDGGAVGGWRRTWA